MVKAKKTKFLYLVFALALLASLVPLTALPAAANGGPRLELYPSGSSEFDIIGHVQRVVPVDLGGQTVTLWTIGDVVADTDAQIVSSATGAEGTAYADIVAFTWGEATIMATLSGGGTISAVKKWGQIDWTEISPPNESPVYWKEENKTWTGEGWADDYVMGTFKAKDPDPETGEPVYYHEYAQGAELHWFLINIRAEGAIPRGLGDPDTLIATISGLPRATFVEFVNPTVDPTHTMTVTNPNGWGGVNFTTWGEEAVVIVVVPDYPVDNNLTVVPEITKWNFWTYEMEKVPQVRWAGEKIVLEKYFGPWAAGWPVSFRLENQSVGTLEGAGPIPDFIGFNLSNTNDTVWTMVDEFGWAEAILTSEAPGEADVTLALYNPDAWWRDGWYWIENQHGFVVYFLKLEEITLSNVVGKRAFHNDGPWIPENPWDASLDVLSETLNVSEDTLLRARVKGWFMGDNLSGRDAKYVDFDPQWDTNGDGDPTNDRDLTLPAGRWVLPDDWPILAGPDWVELRKHWDIMDQPDDSIMSVHGNEWGDYLTSNGHGSRWDGMGAEWPVIGPFTPGWELPTPYGWDDDLIFLQKTVVPNGLLNWWDAPMPPAKITFKIKSGPGFFKEADKGLIYYHDDGGIHYTNPFYAVMIPAHWKIPAFINNGGYDWDSWNEYYGPYDFWTIVNRPPNPQQPSDDSANYPTKVQVYSDNHGEAMVFLNGDYNLDLSRWISEGYDVPFGAEVGTTEAEAMADYPYLRKHQAFISNHVEKTWTWGKQILGADPADYPDGSIDPSNTRMVFQVGTIDPVTGLSEKKLAFIWVKDRDGFPAVGERIEWRIGLGTNAEIPPITAEGVSIYLPDIDVQDGFLANTNGRVLNDNRTRGESYTRTATSAERALFNKFWGVDAWGMGYAVAAIEILTSDPEVIDLTIYLNEREGTIIRHTNLDFSVPDALDDPLLRGDANRSGVVNIGDVVSVERMILGLDSGTANADVNGDGVIDMGDVILIERIILGQ